jgi:hypothetical protein
MEASARVMYSEPGNSNRNPENDWITGERRRIWIVIIVEIMNRFLKSPDRGHESWLRVDGNLNHHDASAGLVFRFRFSTLSAAG